MMGLLLIVMLSAASDDLGVGEPVDVIFKEMTVVVDQPVMVPGTGSRGGRGGCGCHRVVEELMDEDVGDIVAVERHQVAGV